MRTVEEIEKVWTEEDEAVGKKFLAKCHANRSYEDDLTEGKIYEIEMTPRILPMSPLCAFTGNRGKRGECHLHRFSKHIN